MVLYGPAGTGKDHLMSSLILDTIRAGFTVKWFNGMDFYGKLRDLIGSESRDTSESRFFDSLAGANVLALSDPIPPNGALTEFQRAQLFRVVDRRYRDEKPTWVTLNVSGRSELDSRIGVQLAERLLHGVLQLPCNWPSHRKARWSPPSQTPRVTSINNTPTPVDEKLLAFAKSETMK